jgi:hypothetical protein
MGVLSFLEISDGHDTCYGERRYQTSVIHAMVKGDESMDG